MPLFTLPSLSSGTYHDGEAVAPGDTVVPVLAVVDANRKTTFVRGSAVTILDLQAPAVSGFAVTQDGSGYTFAPSAGTVRDYTHEAVSVYHVIALAGEGALNATELLALVQAPGNAGQFGSATVPPNTPGQEVALSGLSLGTSKVYGGGSFREIAEGDVVRNYLLAVNPESNTDNAGTLAASSALSTGAVADRTPPAGLGSVTLGAPTNDQIPVQNLDAITDAGDGVSSISVFYNTADDFGGATEVAGVSPPTYNLSGLSGVTEYHVWVTATDGTNAAAEVKVGTATTLDAVDPVISMFDASQTSGYAFAADAGTLSDNADGPLKAYMLLAASQQTTGDLRAILVTNSHKDTMEAGAKDEAFAYTAPGAVSVSSLGLSATQYWTGSAWAAISDAAPAAPHQLWAHLYVMDSSGNDGSAVSAGSIKTVADVTAPAFGGAVALSSPASDSITVAWDASVTDGRGVSGAAVYYSQNDPAEAGSIAAWKADGGTSSAAVDASASGSETVTGLSAGTTYYAYLSASDAAGNALDVATTPASVATDAAEPTIIYGASWVSTTSYNSGTLLIGGTALDDLGNPVAAFSKAGNQGFSTLRRFISGAWETVNTNSTGDGNTIYLSALGPQNAAAAPKPCQFDFRLNSNTAARRYIGSTDSFESLGGGFVQGNNSDGRSIVDSAGRPWVLVRGAMNSGAGELYHHDTDSSRIATLQGTYGRVGTGASTGNKGDITLDSGDDLLYAGIDSDLLNLVVRRCAAGVTAGTLASSWSTVGGAAVTTSETAAVTGISVAAVGSDVFACYYSDSASSYAISSSMSNGPWSSLSLPSGIDTSSSAATRVYGDPAGSLYLATNDLGTVRVYARSGASWAQVGADLTVASLTSELDLSVYPELSKLVLGYRDGSDFAIHQLTIAPVADYEPDFAAALLPYSQDLSEDVVTASGNGDDGRVYLDANPFPMAGQSLTFVSIARYSQDPVSGTAWYMYRDAQSANRPRVTYTGTNFSLSGGSTSDESTTAFPAGFFTSKFLFAFTFETGTRAVNAYLVGKPGGTLTTRSLSAVTNATRLEFGLGQIFWAPDSPAVAYLRKFKFWTSVLSQAEIEAVATAEL